MLVRIKRMYLIVLLTLTAAAAVFLIAVIVGKGSGPRWNEFATVSAVGIGFLIAMCFAALPAIDRPFWCIPALVGAGLAILMMVGVPVYVFLDSTRSWSHFSPPRWVGVFGQLVGTGMTTAALLCLLPFVATLKMKFAGQIMQVATCFGYGVLYLCFQLIIWSRSSETAFDSFFMCVIIACLLGTLALILLNRFFRLAPMNLLSTLVSTVHLRCPRCHKDQDMPVGKARCASCKLKIKIDIEEPKCPKCGYDLHGLTQPRCPECGLVLNGEEVSSELLRWAQANDVTKT